MSKRVLVLDDEQDWVVTLSDLLKGFGMTVTSTLLPSHALELLQKQKYDHVLFDFKMPEMDGDAFLERATALSPGSSYVLMTAYRDDRTAERFRQLGAAAVLMKPVDLEELLKVIGIPSSGL